MKVSQIGFMALGVLMLVGCGDKRENAVNGMFDALSNGDVEQLQEHATQTTSQLFTMAALVKCKAKKNQFDTRKELTSFCMKQVFKDIDIDKVKITDVTDTKAIATVTEVTHGKKTVEKFPLVKVGDNWKVDMKK